MMLFLFQYRGYLVIHDYLEVRTMNEDDRRQSETILFLFRSGSSIKAISKRLYLTENFIIKLLKYNGLSRHLPK